jgi:hypothetical protein
MRGKLIAAFVMTVAASTAVVRAQEAVADEQGQERPAEARRPLRVLDNPYDISSFYRSSQGGGGFYGPIDLLRQPATPYGGRYPIAGFYRSHQGYYFGLQTPVSQNPYAIASYYRSSASNDVRFWHGGYGRPAVAGRPGGYSQYWNSIGENGDVFLMAPTILAPVGALSAIYYSGR